MKILFTGGGTLGSVTPLLAVYEELVARGCLSAPDTLWVGTRTGPERTLVEQSGIFFVPIFAGKLRWYAHWRNLCDPLLTGAGFFQALYRIAQFRPTRIVHAGSFVAVPVAWAGWLCGVPIIIIQLDLAPVLSNRVTAPLATKICIAVPETARFFNTKKTVVTGIPVRRAVTLQPHRAGEKPVVYITGGGTGAESLNTLVFQSLERLVAHAEIVHALGNHKGAQSVELARRYPDYHPFEMSIREGLVAGARADVVVTRAGMGTLAELAVLGKPIIIIPLPHSPQEKNAAYVQSRGAALVLSHAETSPELFADTIRALCADVKEKERLSQNIARLFSPHAAARVADIIILL